ncbi:DNA topoisomerase 3-alpha [Zeugodacus cucurbitae]|uniref:Uncharacterized protein n=1 Tax=Zeugodacus cucurbitae TaxID=28588 RepID=A0A0A1XL34_ZEUCU|nr:DNA topoisomerase 3-alpha [Zeugodacus cucurbitae]
MTRTVLRIFLLMAVAMSLTYASGNPALPWGIPGIKPEGSSTTLAPSTASPTRGTCPEPSEELMACMRQWACQYLIRLDLRCLLNLNGLPLIGNVLGGVLGGGGQSPTQQPALGGGGGGILGGSGGGLLGGPGGLLGGLLG